MWLLYWQIIQKTWVCIYIRWLYFNIKKNKCKLKLKWKIKQKCEIYELV